MRHYHKRAQRFAPARPLTAARGAIWMLVPSLLAACANHARPPGTATGLRHEPSVNSVTPQVHVLVQHPTLFVKRHGKLVWELSAYQTRAAMASQVARITDVSGVFYREGSPAVKVSAPAATIDYQHKTLFLGEGVTVADPTQFQRFTADRVQWEWDAHNGLVATGNIRFTRGELVVTGGRLDADLNLRTARLSQGPVARAPESSVPL